MKAAVIFIVSMCLVCACSSGGGSKKKSTVTESEESTVLVDQNISVDDDYVQPLAAELNAEYEFEFLSSKNLEFNFEDGQDAATKKILSICHLDSLGEVNTSNCILKARAEKEYEISIELGNDINALILLVYILGEKVEVEHYSWNRKNGMYWQVKR